MIDRVQMVWNIGSKDIAELTKDPKETRSGEEIILDLIKITGLQWPDITNCINTGLVRTSLNGEH